LFRPKKKHEEDMTPQKEFCPNMDCPDRGKIGEGNVVCHSQKEKAQHWKV